MVEPPRRAGARFAGAREAGFFLAAVAGRRADAPPAGRRKGAAAQKGAAAHKSRADVHASVRHALTLFEDYAGLQRRLAPEVVGLLQGLDDEQRVLFGIAAHLHVTIEQRQRLHRADQGHRGSAAAHGVTAAG